MRLIHESTPQRNLAQGHIGLKHGCGSQFDATPDHEGMRGVAECGPESARKMRFAAPNQSTQIRDAYATGDMPVDIVEHLEHLPCQQALSRAARNSNHRLWIKLTAQQRGCREYRAMRRLFLVKMADDTVKQGDSIVQPITGSVRGDPPTGLCFVGLSLHAAASGRGTVSAAGAHVDSELQWIKPPPFEGFSRHARPAVPCNSARNDWRDA
jgi:predicted  nucleic acid-binding Zn-ribbon protein